MKLFAVIGVLVLAFVLGSPAQQVNSPTRFGIDLQGQPVAALNKPGSSLVVLFFVASDCPISNRFIPEINRIRAEFAADGVSFWQVYPNATETHATVLEHEREFASEVPILIDPDQHTMSLTGAGMTPSGAILMVEHGSLHVVYVGRIDNRYVSIGTERPRATQHDLEDAIRAALEHRAIKPPGGPAVGCGIVRQK